MLTIGEFSASARLTVKALRMYHEEGILVPEKTDPATGYRYYGESSWKRAQAVSLLRELGFSHNDLKSILSECDDDDNLQRFLQKRLESVEGELVRLRSVHDRITLYLETGKGDRMKHEREIKDKVITPSIICGLRYTGRYNEIGKHFAQLFKKAGRYASGCPMAFYHHGEYREDDADIEAALPVRKEVKLEGIDCRTIPEMRVLSLIHYGPYETLGDSYRLLFDTIASRGLSAGLPSVEIFIKGPGLIFPRDPKNFVTEIRIPISS